MVADVVVAELVIVGVVSVMVAVGDGSVNGTVASIAIMVVGVDAEMVAVSAVAVAVAG